MWFTFCQSLFTRWTVVSSCRLRARGDGKPRDVGQNGILLYTRQNVQRIPEEVHPLADAGLDAGRATMKRNSDIPRLPMPSPLILASASPRRRQLLACLGLDFACERADIDETPWPQEAPVTHARRLALTKAGMVAARRPQAIILAADTVVVHDGRILGKPADAAEARRMLRALRGGPHEVISAVAVAANGRAEGAEHVSRVWMRAYSDAEIEAYIATGDPFDKAGAYAIQHPDFRPVACFEGCFASIMGLPLGLVADLLARQGLVPDPAWPSACQALTGGCCHMPR